jgi:anionic cell wall polymer biosynthesis LytR-Cps2A-Psr (LCP) family protein
MSGFAATVDELGGVTIANSVPTRDLLSGLNLLRVGPVHLDGTQALALVRSRSPQTLRPTGWSPVTAAEGDADRTQRLGAMFRALAAQAQATRGNPVTLQKLGWELTGSLTMDAGTNVLSLLRLNLHGAKVKDLPVQVLGANGIGATANAATHQVLAAAGYTQPCGTG